MGVWSLDDVPFPGTDVRLDEVLFTTEVLEVSAVACGPPPHCPGYRARAQRVHSTYERGPAGRPLAARELQIRLGVRRFFCDRASCRRRTVVEQVEGLSERDRRSSPGTKRWVRAVADKLGGRAGERLCRRLHLAVGRSKPLKPARTDAGPRARSRQVVRRHLAALRAGTARPVRADIPSPRKITSWIMRPREVRTGGQEQPTS